MAVLYDRLPAVRITNFLQEVDEYIGFTDAFTHVRTGSPCADRTRLLAEGLNLGLSKMAEATKTQDYPQLSRLSRWHIESDALVRALARVIEAQAGLPMESTAICGAVRISAHLGTNRNLLLTIV